MHSLKSLTNLLPSPIGTLAWGVASLGVTWQAVRTWRRPGIPVVLQVAVLMLASVLVSPHVTLYDATLLSLPLLWVGGWVQSTSRGQSRFGKRFWATLYWLFVAFMIPTAMLLRVQFSVLLMLFLFFELTRELRGCESAVTVTVPQPMHAHPGVLTT